MKAVPVSLISLIFLMFSACSSGGVDDTCECTAGHAYCDGHILMVCPQSRVAYTMIDCSLGGDGYTCEDGVCVPGTGDGDVDATDDADDPEDEITERDTDSPEDPDADQADENDMEPEISEEDGDVTDIADTEEASDSAEEEQAEQDSEIPEQDTEEQAEADTEPETFDTSLLGSYRVKSRLSISTGMSNFTERMQLFDRFFSNDICSLVFETLAEEPGQEQYYASLMDSNGGYTPLGQQSCQTIYAGLVALSALGHAESPVNALYQILAAVHMEGSYTFTAEPGATFDSSAAQFSYDSFYVQWERGCDEGDSACMRRDLDRSNIAVSQVGGAVSGSRDAVSMAFDAHGLPVLFSMLARTVINTIILPELYPSEEPWTYLPLVSQVFGGRDCSSAADCCSAYADTIAGDEQPGLWSDTKDACEVVCARLANNLNATLDAQDPPMSSEYGLRPLRLRTGGSCLMEDSDNNGVIDRIGHQEEGQRCQWHGEYYLSSGQEHPQGIYYGERQ